MDLINILYEINTFIFTKIDTSYYHFGITLSEMVINKIAKVQHIIVIRNRTTLINLIKK